MSQKEPPNLFDEWDDPAAFSTGFYDGFRRINPRPDKERYTADNPYYYQAGYVLGYTAKVLLVVLVAETVGLDAIPGFP